MVLTYLTIFSDPNGRIGVNFCYTAQF